MIKFSVLAPLLCSPRISLFGSFKDQGIIDLDRSPHAVMHPMPVRAVKLGDGFWQERRRVNV